MWEEGTEAEREEEKVTGEEMMMSDFVNDQRDMRFRKTRHAKTGQTTLIQPLCAGLVKSVECDISCTSAPEI